jgi:hypothetical protein
MNRRIAVLVAAAIVVSPITAFAQGGGGGSGGGSGGATGGASSGGPREQRAAPQTTG